MEYTVEIINQREDAFQLMWDHNREIGRTLSDEELKRGIEKFIDKGNAIAVIRDGIIIAFLLLYCNDYDTLQAYICNVYVLEQYRRKHMAESMMRKAIEICKEKQFRSVHLHASESYAPAVALYRKLGFSFADGYRGADREMILELDE